MAMQLLTHNPPEWFSELLVRSRTPRFILTHLRPLVLTFVKRVFGRGGSYPASLEDKENLHQLLSEALQLIAAAE
jgi:hypothetical protein